LSAYLLIVLGRVLKQNGKVLKKIYDIILERMNRGFELIPKLIVEENDRTKKQILEALRK
jgi:hypothetical protein